MPQVIDSSEIGYEVVTDTQSNTSSTPYAELIVSAPEGKVAIAAGFEVLNFEKFKVGTFKPVVVDGVATGWKLGGGDPIAPSGSWTMALWVVCIKA